MKHLPGDAYRWFVATFIVSASIITDQAQDELAWNTELYNNKHWHTGTSTGTPPTGTSPLGRSTGLPCHCILGAGPPSHPPARSLTMVPVEHVQLAACMLGLLLQPLEEVEDLDLLVAAVQHIANLREGSESQCRKDDENMDAGPEGAGTRHLA